MAAPTQNTRYIAHATVGIGGGYAAKKIFGTGGVLVFLAGLVLVVILHEMLDAPLAKAMTSVGLQF